MEEREPLQFSEDGEYTVAANKLAVQRFRHPIEDIEPEIIQDNNAAWNAGYRAAAMRFRTRVLNGVLSSIIEADNPLHQAWACAFAMGSGVCAGRSMNSVGDDLGVGRAALSKAAKAFCKSLELPPSTYMKTAENASQIYREARIRSVRDNQERTECQN